MAASSASLSGASASDLLRSSTSGFNGVPLRTLGKGKLVLKRRDFTVAAKLRKVKKHEYPWPPNPDPNVKGGVLSHLSMFKPLKEKPKPVTLDFEKPLVDLQKKIIDVQKMANETGLDFSDQILSLETKYQQALKDLYTHLTPIQRVNIARHPNRPTFLDHFVELHGDRAGYDDPAIVTGLGTIDGRSYMFIGHQKGRNTKENIQRNFGMPTPHGYRKALRLMEYADHHGFPIVTFIDTPGAYADLKSEELGQGEAIAHNLRSMFGLKVPVISIVIGEGGSGGALAIGCANKLLMLENAVFYVASPEACAAILWKTAKASPKAAEKLKITATELCKLQIADGVIPEPLGGAHADPEWTSQQIKKAIKETMDELMKMNTEELLKHRMLKFRKIGGFQEGIPIDPKRKANMKKRDLSIAKISDAELEVEVEKLKQQVLEAKESSPVPPKLDLDEMLKQLTREVDLEYSEAVKATGLTDSLLKLREEVSKANADNQIVDPLLKDKIEKLRVEFEQQLRAAPNYGRLQNKFTYLSELCKVKLLSDANKDNEAVTFKQELEKKVDNALSNPKIRETFEALKAEIKGAGASSASDLDDELKKKIVEFMIELKEVKEVKEVIENQIESLVNSSDDIKNKVLQLKLEVPKAGETPDSESKSRIGDFIFRTSSRIIMAILLRDMFGNFKEIPC
ncbi:Acetyl-coenzyme A carboxylase carboxyl transferase subunit alpha, chloroplastic isoform B [Glycine soja]|uniref:acetyl-CoA carboxytransferase n=1 Tax=Glycine soja TaxID=3848 RepID=A0A445FV39_GLYSO|nr:Acetyl-coenzyme A carboxylase carboxyl transferase subunit alpha, chloroplastic isoform B [Glycine soja]